MKNYIAITVLVTVLGAAGPGFSQSQAPPTPAPPGQTTPTPTTYRPKFHGDPARSDAEASALGYMRVVLRAQREYKKRHDQFAEALPALAGTGTFTKRMAGSTDRGDYTVEFHGKKESFTLAMIPKQFDDQHRSFYAEDDGVIHAEEGRPATAASPKLK
jgi:hypothetical protein